MRAKDWWSSDYTICWHTSSFTQWYTWHKSPRYRHPNRPPDPSQNAYRTTERIFRQPLRYPNPKSLYFITWSCILLSFYAFNHHFVLCLNFKNVYSQHCTELIVLLYVKIPFYQYFVHLYQHKNTLSAVAYYSWWCMGHLKNPKINPLSQNKWQNMHIDTSACS